MIDDKDFLKIIKYLFGFGSYTEMFSRIDNDTGLRENDTGLRENGITIVRTEKTHPDLDSYKVTINWELLEKIIGGEK